MSVGDDDAEGNNIQLPYAISLTATVVGIAGGVIGIIGGVFGISAYFQADRLAAENAALSQELTEASNTFVALQTRISACHEIAAHHRRQANEDEAAGYVENRQLIMPDGGTEKMSSNYERFVASITMSRALSLCLTEGGNLEAVRNCITEANADGSRDYPRHVVDAIDDQDNGSRHLAC